MWYSFAKQIFASEADLDRETLDMTGGVSSPNAVQVPKKPVQNTPVLPIEPADELESADVESVVPVTDDDNELDTNVGTPENTFTDYTPPSTADEHDVEDSQTAYRAQDLIGVMQGAGVVWPMHEGCRCRIQFRPDDSSDELLVPRWEVSNSACGDCLKAQQAFNSYVEGAGIRVEAPEGAIGGNAATVNVPDEAT